MDSPCCSIYTILTTILHMPILYRSPLHSIYILSSSRMMSKTQISHSLIENKSECYILD